MGKMIGIDLGTTYSAAAHLDGEGKPVVIENREGERITPSAVNFDGDGNPIVGSMAKSLSVEHPENTVQYVKRSMGDPNWKYPADNGTVYSAEEISALILKRLKEDAEAVLGEPVTHAVITVPAYFDDARRVSTQNAGQIAGLEVMKIINEPTAAALAYGCSSSGTKDETIAVFDLGGGTFDVTVMRVSKGGIEVLSTAGDRNLGGFDYDNAVMMWLNEEAKKACGADILAEDNGEALLREKAEGAKRALTLRESAPVSLISGDKRCKIELSRVKFNELTDHLTRRAMDITKATLEEAARIPEGQNPSFAELIKKLSITKILLVGGSTRMPVIRETLEKETGIRPSIELNPDEVVALGAAIQGGILLLSAEQEKKKGSAKKTDSSVAPPVPDIASIASKEELNAISERYGDISISDVCSHGLGLVSLKGNNDIECNAIVMPKNTPIPSRVSKRFNTAVDNQQNLYIRVTEGDDESLDMVEVIGEAEMAIDPHPKKSPLDVHFEYDASGIVHVGITDLTNGKYLGEVTINRTANLNREDLAKMKRKMSSITVD